MSSAGSEPRTVALEGLLRQAFSFSGGRPATPAGSVDVHRSLAGVAWILMCAPALAIEPMPNVQPPDAATPRASSHAVPMDRTAIEGAVAGSVVATLAERFGGRAVEVRFGTFEVREMDGRQRSIRGEGGMRFAGDSGWIGFRFDSIHDTLLGQAGPPVVELGVGGDSRAVPNDGLALRQLEDRMTDILQRDTGIVGVRLQLDRVETLEMAQHYLVMQAQGLADFGREGSSDVRIRALYNRRDGEWLQLDHVLGTAPQTASLQP